MILVVPLFIRKGSSSVVLGFSLYAISSVYFGIEFITGLIFIFLASDSFMAAFVVQLVIAGVYALVLLPHLAVNESTADHMERHADEVVYIKDTASRVKALIGRATNSAANRAMERAYDLLHASPTQSVSAVKSLEKEIQNHVSALEEAVCSNDTAAILEITAKITAVTEERNRKLKIAN